MGHSHTGSGSASAAGRHRWRLAVAFLLVAGFFVVELLAGLNSGSLALISDAGHMAADVVALGAALAATRIATRPDRTGRRTYGSYRVEVFASGLTVLIMLGAAAYVLIEAVRRIGESPSVGDTTMAVVGGIGLAVNLGCLVLLRTGAQEALSLRGAYLEVAADAAGSVGVIAAAVLVAVTGWSTWDTMVALAIGVFVAVRALLLGREVVAVLGQHVPADVDLDAVVADLAAAAGVAGVHDLHLWTLTSGMNVATAHLVAAPGADPQTVLDAARSVLAERHHIDHATLQVEAQTAPACHEVTW
ncbi:MAG: cation diffusion facilitator family transporter [Nocardioides sp.]